MNTISQWWLGVKPITCTYQKVHLMYALKRTSFIQVRLIEATIHVPSMPFVTRLLFLMCFMHAVVYSLAVVQHSRVLVQVPCYFTLFYIYITLSYYPFRLEAMPWMYCLSSDPIYAYHQLYAKCSQFHNRSSLGPCQSAGPMVSVCQLLSYAPVPLCQIYSRTRTNGPFQFIRGVIPGHSSSFLFIQIVFFSFVQGWQVSTKVLNMFKTLCSQHE